MGVLGVMKTKRKLVFFKKKILHSYPHKLLYLDLFYFAPFISPVPTNNHVRILGVSYNFCENGSLYLPSIF